jgi:hypothetical protein
MGGSARQDWPGWSQKPALTRTDAEWDFGLLALFAQLFPEIF